MTLTMPLRALPRPPGKAPFDRPFWILDNERNILLRDGLPVLFVPLGATAPFWFNGDGFEEWLPDLAMRSHWARRLLFTHEDAYFARKTDALSMGCAYGDIPGKGRGAYVLRYYIRDQSTLDPVAWCFVQTKAKAVYRVHDFDSSSSGDDH